MDILTLLSALSGAARGGLEGFQLGSSLRDRQRERDREDRRDQDTASYRASQSINQAMSDFDKQQRTDERRGRLAKGNRAILDSTPEGQGVIQRLGADADAVLGDYEPSALDDLINRIRPPKVTPERIDPLSEEGLRGTMQLDENRAKLRQRYPSSSRRGGSTNPESQAIMQMLSTLNSQIDDNRMRQTQLSKPLQEAEEGGYDVAPGDTAGLGAAQREGTRLTGMRDKATTGLMATSPVLAKLFASDSGATPPPPGGVGNIDLRGPVGPPRGVAQPLSEKEKYAARSNPKFRDFLKAKGYTERDWQ